MCVGGAGLLHPVTPLRRESQWSANPIYPLPSSPWTGKEVQFCNLSLLPFSLLTRGFVFAFLIQFVPHLLCGKNIFQQNSVSSVHWMHIPRNNKPTKFSTHYPDPPPPPPPPLEIAIAFTFAAEGKQLKVLLQRLPHVTLRLNVNILGKLFHKSFHFKYLFLSLHTNSSDLD